MMNTGKKVLGPVNLGNPTEFTIQKLAELTLNLTGSLSKINYTGKFREDDPMQRCPDITKAKQILGWSPTVPLEEGLKKTIADFKTRLSL